VSFPAPGLYPFELDYSECCGQGLSLTLTASAGPGYNGLAPAGSLELTPAVLSAAQLVNTVQNFQVKAKDASGALLANVPVTLFLTGGNPQQLSAVTNASGVASFSYTSTVPRVTDTLLAKALISGAVVQSNAVQVSWTNGTNVAPLVNAGEDVTVTMPEGAGLSGTVTDDGLPSSSALTITWTKISGPGDVTFEAPQKAAPVAYFSATGVYVLQLMASDGSLISTDTVQVTPA